MHKSCAGVGLADALRNILSELRVEGSLRSFRNVLSYTDSQLKILFTIKISFANRSQIAF